MNQQRFGNLAGMLQVGDFQVPVQGVPEGCLTDACIKGGQRKLPGVTPSRASPPHPQGAQEEGDEEHANAGEQQVEQALHDNAHDTQRHRHDHQQ